MDQRYDSSNGKFRRSILIAVSIVLSALVGVWFVREYGTVALGSGGYRLTVHIESELPIGAVRCYAFFRQREAELFRDTLDMTHLASWDGNADPFLGEPIQVYVSTWSRSSWIEDTGGHEEWLTILAELKSGEKIAKVAAIPDMSTARELRINLP